MSLSLTDLFLAVSLFTSFATGAVSWAESGARARLLWLRVPGSRAQVWEKVERELWDYFLLLSGVVAVVSAVLLLAGAGSMMLLHYILLLFTLTVYQRYLPLAARLNAWSSLTQAVVLLASVVAIAVTVVYSLNVANFDVFFLLELCLLLLGALFRSIAKFGFTRADWQVLRPTPSKRAGASA